MAEDPIRALRARIDGIDRRLLALVNRRAKLAAELGRRKRISSAAPCQPDREAEIVRAALASNPGPLRPGQVERIYRELISACLAIQAEVRVGFLGPEGTFSHEAAVRQFGGSATFVPMEGVRDILGGIEKGACDIGVVPVENSTEGTVGQTLDLMLDAPARVCAETVVRIRQHLMAKPGGRPGSLTRVLSHPQSFAQCRQWLRANLPGCELVDCSSNAAAARAVAHERSVRVAAIGPRNAADVHGLEVLAADIEDDPRNNTRFWVVGDVDTRPTGKDKTSIAMTASEDKAGGLLELLRPFAKEGINMTKLESRPSPSGKIWEYVFFVDFEGHLKEPGVARALGTIRARAGSLRVLGSYPAAR